MNNYLYFLTYTDLMEYFSIPITDRKSDTRYIFLHPDAYDETVEHEDVLHQSFGNRYFFFVDTDNMWIPIYRASKAHKGLLPRIL